MKPAITAIIVLLPVTAIAQTRVPVDTAPSAPSPAAAGDLFQRNGGSLLRTAASSVPDPNQAKISNVSFFAVPDPTTKAYKKHDLITIIINEDSVSKSQGLSDLQKQADFDAKITQFLKVSHNSLRQGIGGTVPEIDLSGTRNLKGQAEVDRSDVLTMRVTGEVLDVKPNGTLVLQARQRIKQDDEEMSFILAGTCRVEDITADNTVLSTQMFDKDLTKMHKGAVHDTTQRGWVPRLLDVLNPF